MRARVRFETDDMGGSAVGGGVFSGEVVFAIVAVLVLLLSNR